MLLGAGQFAFRLFLARAEADDTGSLLKGSSSFLPAAGEDDVNVALADDGISFPANACIIKELMDVPEPAVPFVEGILALPVRYALLVTMTSLNPLFNAPSSLSKMRETSQ